MMISTVTMLDPATVSIAIFLATRKPPKNKRHICRFIKRNKREIISTLVDEFAEPVLDQVTHMLPSWASLTFYAMMWLLIWIV